MPIKGRGRRSLGSRDLYQTLRHTHAIDPSIRLPVSDSLSLPPDPYLLRANAFESRNQHRLQASLHPRRQLRSFFTRPCRHAPPVPPAPRRSFVSSAPFYEGNFWALASSVRSSANVSPAAFFVQTNTEGSSHLVRDTASSKLNHMHLLKAP